MNEQKPCPGCGAPGYMVARDMKGTHSCCGYSPVATDSPLDLTDIIQKPDIASQALVKLLQGSMLDTSVMEVIVRRFNLGGECERQNLNTIGAIKQANNCLNIVALIDLLREKECATVSIVSDNPDFNGQPNCLVIVSSVLEFDGEKFFRADTVLECLQEAVKALK